MKIRTLAVLVILNLAVLPKLFSQNVAVNATGNLPDTSAMLDISSTDKGFLMPRMTTVQRNAIILPANGLILYNTTTNAFQVNTGTTTVPVWSTLGNGSGSVTSIATGYGLSGGPITSAGTLIVDTLSLSGWYIRRKDSTGNSGFTTLYQNSLKQNQLNGTGFVKANGSTISYDNSSYITDNQTITFTPTGDVTGTTNGTTLLAPALTIGNNKVTLGQMAQVANGTFLGRTTAGTGNVEALTTAQAKALLGSTGTNTGDVTLAGQTYLTISGQTITANAVNLSGAHVTGILAAGRFPGLTGDVTNTPGFLATTISSNAITTAKILNANVTNAKLANMAANTIKGNNTAGATSPLDLTATEVTAMLNPYAGAVKGLVPTGGSTANFLRGDGTWQPVSATAWSLTGNSGTTAATNFIGTTDANGFRIKGNNIQGLLVDSLGNVAVGTNPTFTALPAREKFLVDAGTTSSINAISAKGSINSYLQLNIQNQSSGTSASSDIVATSNTGNESINFIDMGINGSGNTANVFGNANDAYLFNQGENFFIANSTPAKSLILMTGGTDSATNERMRISGTGNIGIANAAPSEKLDVTGNIKFSGALMPNNLPGNIGNVLTSNGAGAPPTWSTAITGSNTGDVTLGTANGLSLSGQVLSLGLASTSTTGALSSTDWNTFNNKLTTIDTTNIPNFSVKVRGLLSAGTGISYNNTSGLISNTGVTSLNGGTGDIVFPIGNLTETGSSVLTVSGGTGAVLGTGTTIAVKQASAVQSGFLSSTDWTTFNNKADVANGWSITGNSGINPGTNFLGTTDNKSLRFRTNNTQQMKIDSVGNVAIGQDFFDATNPEKFVINAGITNSVNAFVTKGSINTYFQMNIKNLSTGSNATSDLVATADNGTETTNYVDLGINGSGYTGSAIETGVANDGYLISAGNDFYVVNSTANKNMLFLTGGTGVANERMRILANGRIGMGVQNPTAPLVVKDTMEIRRTGSLSQLLFTNTGGSGDFRIGGDGGDLFWQGGGSRSLQMGSFWPTIIQGDRQTATYPAFTTIASGTGVLIPAARDASVPLAITQYSGSQTSNLTEWRTSSGTALSAIDKNGNLGLGNSSPSQKLDVTGNIRFSGALMPNNLPGAAGNVLISNGAGAAPTWSTALSGTNTGDVTLGTANGLSLTGQVLSLGLASTSATGALSSTDWNTFNSKGSGSVTSVSVTTANGVSGAVATATTTPAITLTLGAITPTSVAATGTVTGSNLSGTNTGNVTIGTANGLSLASQALSLGLASTTTTGALSSTDWNTFNTKGSGSVTSIATGYGLSGGTITATGTLTADSATLSNYYVRRKDSSANGGYYPYATNPKNYLTGNQTITLSGDISGTGTSTITTTLPTVNANVGTWNNVTVNGKGLVTAGSNVSYLSGNQTISFAPTGDVTGSTTGTTTLAPALVIGTNKVLNSMLAQMPTLTIKGNNTGGTANASDLTVAQVNAILPVFTSTLNGLVPFSGGSAGKVLHGDGTWKDTATATNQWSILGNVGTSASTNFLGTTDATDLVFKTNNTERMRIVNGVSASSGTAGDLTIGDANSGTVRSNKELVFREDGDQFGPSVLRLRNRNGENGAIFETIGASAALVDFLFKTGTVSTPLVSNIRFETRAVGAGMYITGNTTEWQIGQPANPTLIVSAASSGNSALRIGNLGIGNVNPTEKLDVTGNLKFSGALMPNNLPGAAGNVLTSNGAGAAPTWSTAITGTNTGDVTIGTANGLSLAGQALSLALASTSTTGALSSTDWNTFNNKVSTARTISTTAPLQGGGDLSVNRTLSITDAAADGTTKGASTYTAVDFNTAAGLVSLDYTNGQAASASNKGFLTSADWTTFNNKASSANTWNLGGNNVASAQNIGTTSNFDFPFITNNTEKMRLSAGGNLGIGATVVDGTNAEKLLVDAGTNSYNVISGKGNNTGYLQLNIKNSNSGATASTDVVATNDAGTEANQLNFVDMGVNSSGNLSTGVLGGANTGYLYSTGSDFAIGNATAAKSLLFFTGGTGSNERMRIDGNGNVGIGTTSPTQKLDVNGTIVASGTTYPNYQYNSANRMIFGETNILPSETGSVVQYGSGSNSRNMVFAFTKSNVNSSFLGNDGTQTMLGSEGTTNPITFRTGLVYNSANIIASGSEAMRITGSGNVGIGTISPSQILDVNGNVKFSGALMPNNQAGNLGEFLISGGSGANPTWFNATPFISTVAWVKAGNAGTTSNTDFIGTTDFKSLKFKTNNAQGILLDSLGNVAVGLTPTFTALPSREKFLVDAGTTTSVNVISAKGTIDSYLQLNIQNKSATSGASSDIVATADNGDESNAYVDLGINSSAYNNASYNIGGFNDSYLYSVASASNVGGNFSFGTASSGKVIKFNTGGTTTSNERMRIDGTGNVGIGTTTPTSTLDVKGSVSYAINLTTVNTTLGATDHTLIITGGTPIITLPAASTCTGREYTIVNQTGSGRTISSFIDFSGVAQTTIVNVNAITIQSNGTNWYRIR